VKAAIVPIEPEPSKVHSIAAARTRRATVQVMGGRLPAEPALPERSPLVALLIGRELGFSDMA
jgi:hypothetical protein